jgi:hypothetical protein
MAPFQMWLEAMFSSVRPVASLMRTAWAWPAMESVHFVGLSLLVGTILVFDLRMLGMARRVPMSALHRLIPWGVLGYAINVISGSMFLMTEPNQYLYNPAFHFKVAFMGLAGLNILVFYFTATWRRVSALGPGDAAPRLAKVVAATSLCLWLGVIICGRLITFYRPSGCGPEGPGFLAECIPRKARL